MLQNKEVEPKRITPEQLREYGGRFSSMNDEEAIETLDNIYQFCEIIYQNFSESNLENNE